MRSSTSVWSAICGTHFGETKAVASTAGSPASARRSMSSSFTAVGTSAFSFCRPSRGPTSTSRTVSGILISLQRNQLRAFQNLLACVVKHLLHHAVRGRGNGVLHLHGFQNEERLALRHFGARLGHHLDHFAGHRCSERAARGVGVGGG